MPRRRRQVLLAFANPAAPGEGGEQALVHARIERRKLEPLLEVAEQPRRRWPLPRRCSSSAAWQPRNRRRCAVSQPLKEGLRSISRPSRNSPLKRAQSARSRSGASVSMPCWAAQATSTASTRQSERSSLTLSPGVSTRRRPGPSRTLLSLLRHQRSSPRGSLGTSQSSSHKRTRGTACGARDEIGRRARAPCANPAVPRPTPSGRRIARAPSNSTCSKDPPRAGSDLSVSTGISTRATTPASTQGRYSSGQRATALTPRPTPPRARRGSMTATAARTENAHDRFRRRQHDPPTGPDRP